MTKSSFRLRALALAACCGALLVGCGGGSDTADSTTPPVDPAPPADMSASQLTAIKTAITDLEAKVEAVVADAGAAAVADADAALQAARAAINAATDVSQDVKDEHTGRIDLLASSLIANKQSRTAKMFADGKALGDALGNAPLSLLEDRNGLNTVDIDDDGNIDITAGGATPALAAVKLEPTEEDAGKLGNWKGVNYSNEDSTNKITNTALLYTNQEDPKDLLVKDRYPTEANRPGGNNELVTDYGADTRTLTLAEAKHADMASPEFPTADTEFKKTFASQNPGGSEITPFAGSYNGIEGDYYCTGTCSATWSSTGITLAGTWTFIHDEGATVEVQEDNSYMYFGWWLREDKNGPTDASAFYGTTRAITSGTNYSDAANYLGGDDTIGGSATYTGNAAGKFSISDEDNKTGRAGHFTADVSLSAKFAGGEDGGLMGTIDNFMAGDESLPTWKVTLQRVSFDDTATVSSGNNKTVWYMDGTAADASGTWEATMYDLDDDSNTKQPTHALGEFQSLYGATGRMVGAFGATKD